MNLVFFGTGSFATPTLRKLAPHIRLVVTQPPKESGRERRLQLSEVGQLGEELGLRVLTPIKARSAEFVSLIAELRPDALLVASYGQILSQSLLDTALRGGINLHGSLLPRFRGAAPIQRALLCGESVTGVTVMQMDKGMDTGNIIENFSLPLSGTETYGEVQQTLSEIAAELAETWLPKIVSGAYESFPQDESIATMAPKTETAEGELTLREDARSSFNRYRAFTPKPGAFLMTAAGKTKVIRASYVNRTGSPGSIIGLEAGLLVAFEGGALNFSEVQPEGKKKMSGRDYANGARLRIGMTLLENR